MPTAGQLLGFAMMFALCLMPAGLFLGVLLGGICHLSLRARYALTVAAAAALAYGAVFKIGTAAEDIVSLLVR